MIKRHQMIWERLSEHIIERVYELLNFADKLAFVEAIDLGGHSSSVLHSFKLLTIYTSFCPIFGEEYGFFLGSLWNCPSSWGHDSERQRNWVPLCHLSKVLRLSICVDLVFYLKYNGRNEIFLEILPHLNLRNVNSVSFEFLRICSVIIHNRKALYNWYDIFNFGNATNVPRLSTLRLGSPLEEIVSIPKELDLDELIIGNLAAVKQLPRKVRNLVIDGSIPNSKTLIRGIQSLKILSTRIDLKVVKQISKLIIANAMSLNFVQLRVWNDPCNIDKIITNLLKVPSLKRFCTNCPFNVNLLDSRTTRWNITERRYEKFYDFGVVMYIWEKQLTSSNFSTDLQPEDMLDQNVNINPWQYTLLDLIMSLPNLRVLEASEDVRISEIHPKCVEELRLGRISDGPLHFSAFNCLHSLELTNISLHAVRTLPRSLVRLTGTITAYYCMNSLNMNYIFRQVPELKYLNIDQTDVPIICLFPSALEDFSLNYGCGFDQLPKRDSAAKNMINYFNKGFSFLQLSFPSVSTISNSHLKYLCLRYPTPSDDSKPITLPSSLEVLLFSSRLSQAPYLQFPKKCNTNLRFLQFISFGSYSFYNIGSGRDGTCHGRLQHMSSNRSPQVGGIESEDELTDDICFNDANCPPNLLQLLCVNTIFLNPRVYSQDQMRMLRQIPLL